MMRDGMLSGRLRERREGTLEKNFKKTLDCLPIATLLRHHLQTEERPAPDERRNK